MPYTRKCKHCNNIFILKNIAYEKRGGGKYCSKQCSKYATKKHNFDENFFDDINTEEKAYWLGFCMADAYNNNNELRIELSADDDSHLSKMANSLLSSQKISYRKRGSYKMASINFASRHMCKQLSKLGCIKNKTYTLYYPIIKLDLNCHFIRGYFDGDGCISNGQWSIYGASQMFVSQIKQVLEQEAKITLHEYPQGENGRRLVLYKKEYINKLYKYLYDGASIFMDRKRCKFMTHL